MPRSLFIAFILATAPACGATTDDTCPTCSAPSSRGRLINADLIETSGVAASQRHADLLYAHNDSGDKARFFAFSPDGADLGVFKVEDADNIDWEDLAVGPCGAGSCIYIADTGDNDLTRKSYTIYRIVEPEAVGAGEQSLPSEGFEFTYPDGPHDVETLLIHPDTGVLTLITKVKHGAAGIYELSPPLTTDRTLMAVKRGALAPPEGDHEFTGGALHPDATGVLLRTQTNLFHYRMTAGQSAAEALTGPACAVPAAAENYAEAVTWLAKNAGILTVGEGLHSEINISACDP